MSPRKKESVPKESPPIEEEPADVKIGRGRPRKFPKGERDSSEEPKDKRPRGRPKGSTKETLKKKKSLVTSPGGRGRPRRLLEDDTKSPRNYTDALARLKEEVMQAIEQNTARIEELEEIAIGTSTSTPTPSPKKSPIKITVSKRNKNTSMVTSEEDDEEDEEEEEQ